MPQDAYTLRYLCGELNKIFCGGKINRIVQPSNDELVFTVYTGKRTEKLLVDVNPAAPRIGITEAEKESPLTAPNFCMLLRKHLLSATVDNISLVGFDRIVKIDVTPSSEFFDAEKKTLYIELMGRYSNVILTENGKVLGGNRGINCFDNGVRPLIVGRDYVFPPVGEKKLPSDKSAISAFSAADGGSLARITAETVQGIALSTAKEIADGYFAENSVLTAEKYFDYLNCFLFRENYEPCVIKENGAVKDVCVFPYKSVPGEVTHFATLLAAEEYYFAEKDRLKKFNALKDRLSSSCAAALKKANKRLNAIAARERDASDAEENRLKGELILANIYKFKGGETSCELDNYYDGSKITVSLERGLSASANAERYYKKYGKQKRAVAALAPQREAAESDIAYLKSLADFIALAEDVGDLVCVKEEMTETGMLSEKNSVRAKKKQSSNGREYRISDYTVRVGRNNTENDKIVFSSKPEDLWLHAKNYHSSHAVISGAQGEIPQNVLKAAAEICAYYSGGREGGKTEIVYAMRKFVKKPRGAKPGFVTYSDFKSILVEPDKHSEFLKKE